TPSRARPPATWAAIQGDDSRVSMPIATTGEGDSRLATRPSATPKACTVRGSSGNSPAAPRMPSVPNSCLPIPLLFLDEYPNQDLRGTLKAHVGISNEGVYLNIGGADHF